MTDSTVTWLRPRGQPAYTDTSALNDIHALLTSATQGDAQALLADIAEILGRSGRPMVRARDIAVTASESPIGWPVARVDAETTTVTVRQDPAGDGLLVEITTQAASDHDALTVTFDGQRLQPPSPGGSTI